MRLWLFLDSRPALSLRRQFLFVSILFAFLICFARAFQIQVLNGETWAKQALDQHQEQMEIIAPRGTIYDRNGVPLATSRPMVKVAVAPREIRSRDRDHTIRQLVDVLNIDLRTARHATDPKRRWVILPGHYEPAVAAKLSNVRGIHFEHVYNRYYPHGSLARELLGPISADGRPLGGIELGFDSMLRGTPGRAVVRRDANGKPIPGAMVTIQHPVAGYDLYLSLDFSLQEIVDHALAEAIEETGALAGEILLVDVKNGEILAAASRHSADRRTWGAVVEPYEPGSTIKPFILAALLAEGHAKLDEVIDAENGMFVADGGRTIRDIRPHDSLSVREAVEKSSNIVLAKLAKRLTPIEQYRYLRDFGFGTLSGIRFPSESSGLLRRPNQWSLLSQQSLAIGYEISATPLQMVMAYAALANDGVLMEPRLVREARQRNEEVLRFPARALRRVIPDTIAHQVADVLATAVESGTGQAASLEVYRVAGKTGTSRRIESGRYTKGAYVASFAGFFPAHAPEIAFVVKLDHPKAQVYSGGLAAAPVVRQTLLAALAAHHSLFTSNVAAIDSSSNRKDRRFAPEVASGEAVSKSSIRIELASSEDSASTTTLSMARVPDVRGLDLREAVRILYEAGYYVKISGRGHVVSSTPAPGARLKAGETVQLQARPRRTHSR